MAARQMWLFLSERDVPQLLSQLEAHEPGLVASEGRYLRGDPRALLSEPAALERSEALPGERRLYLFHRKHSAEVVVHLQPMGPFAGWAQIDEERSDCLILRVPLAPAGEAQPSRLYAHTSFWRGAAKTRKRPMFALWANQTLRRLIGVYPSTAVAFMRVGPDALARARAGSLRLTYLYRPIAPEPSPDAPDLPAPEGTVTEATALDADDEPLGADQTSIVK
jgi:hypothetical protein